MEAIRRCAHFGFDVDGSATNDTTDHARVYKRIAHVPDIVYEGMRDPTRAQTAPAKGFYEKHEVDRPLPGDSITDATGWIGPISEVQDPIDW